MQQGRTRKGSDCKEKIEREAEKDMKRQRETRSDRKRHGEAEGDKKRQKQTRKH